MGSQGFRGKRVTARQGGAQSNYSSPLRFSSNSQETPMHQHHLAGSARQRATVALVSIGVNAILASGEFILGLATGSLALIADSIHSLSDMIISFLVLIGVGIGVLKPKTAALTENIIAFIISLFIMVVSIRMVLEISRPSMTVKPELLPLAIPLTFIFALLNWGLSRYQAKIGHDTNSVSLVAESRHTGSDMLTSFAVIISLMGQLIGLPLDTPIAILIALMILGMGLEVGVTAIIGIAKQGDQKPLDSSFRKVRISAFFAKYVLGSSLYKKLYHRKKILIFIVILIGFSGWGSTGLKIIKPDEVAIQLRHGQLIKILQPGLHLTAPIPIDSVVRVKPEKIYLVEIGFRTTGKSTPDLLRTDYEWDSLHKLGSYKRKPKESLSLTGDENLLDINLVVLYKLSDPKAHLYINDEKKLVQATVESATHEIIAEHSQEHILITDREGIEQKIAKDAQSNIFNAGSRTLILAVLLQDVHPPIEVVHSFRDVYSAIEEKEKNRNDAWGYHYGELAQARSKKTKTTKEAEAYRNSVKEKATGEAARFILSATIYNLDRKLHLFRLNLETIETALKGKRKLIVPGDLPPGTIDLRFEKIDRRR